MLGIGSVELGERPRIVVPLVDARAREDAARAKRLADIFELRIDLLGSHETAAVARWSEGVRAENVPLIATVRSTEEGGGATLSDDDRMRLFETVLPHVDALDIEHRAAIRDGVIALAHRAAKKVIVSHHDFAGTPSDRDLLGIVEEAKEAGADLVKLAAAAQSFRDVERLFGVLVSQRSKHIVAISLGAHGTASRVFFPLFGSLLTYAFLHEAVAPGQLSLQDLHDELRRYDPTFSGE
jgi:3-dehydroquinate dehydratase-1